MAVDKLTSFYLQAAQTAAVEKKIGSDSLIWRVSLEALPKNIDEFRCSGGYFSEYHAKTLDEILPIINKKYQTMSVYGIKKEELQKFVRLHKPGGIDRIVAIGKTLDFSLSWDGYNLIDTLSRNCDIY